MRKLTRTENVAKIRGTGARFEMADSEEEGLRLRVSSAGVKGWSFLYRVPGGFRRLALGQFPALTLDRARDRARDARQDVKEGRDPALRLKEAKSAAAAKVEERREAAAEAREGIEGPRTVVGLARLCLEALPELRPATRAERERIIRAELLPTFSGRIAEELTSDEIVRWLGGMAHRPVMANRIFQFLRRVMGWAERKERIAVNPMRKVEIPFPKADKDTEREPLSPEELRSLLRALDALEMLAEAERVNTPEGPGQSHVDAVRLLLLTGLRKSSVLGARRSEFTRLDDPKLARWIVPGERVKNGKTIAIPLSEPALEIVRRRFDLAIRTPRRAAQRGEVARMTAGHLFPAAYTVAGQERDRPMLFSSHFTATLRATANAIHGAKLRPWTLHSFRALLATHGAEELRFSDGLVGLLLGHKRVGVTGRYNRAQRFRARRRALRLWALWLESVRKGEPFRMAMKRKRGDVVNMRARA